MHKALGRALATDIHRTYRLEAAGYQVDWSAIPRAITPMNRIMVAWYPNRSQDSPAPQDPKSAAAPSESTISAQPSTSSCV